MIDDIQRRRRHATKQLETHTSLQHFELWWTLTELNIGPVHHTCMNCFKHITRLVNGEDFGDGYTMQPVFCSEACRIADQL